ncbi:MAG: hypothetical protein ACOCUD_02695 [Bacillota bacterium]
MIKINLIKNKKAMSLPAMLGLVIFLIGSVLALLSYMVFQANLIQKNIEYSEEYVNTVTDISAVQAIIARDEITDDTEINNLATYFNLNIETPSTGIYRFSRDLNSVDRTITGYLAPETTIINTYEEIFTYTGTEADFELSPLINATTMLAEYSREYLPEQFSGITLDGDFSTFQGIVDYYRSLTNDYYRLENPNYIENQANPTINDYIFIDGDVNLNNQDLTIADEYTLVIDGNLTTNNNCNITGNIIISGYLDIRGKNRQERNIIGTFYVDGDINIAMDTNIGSSSRPSFMITNGNVYLKNKITIYGYFIANDFSGQQGNNFITGGVYTIEEPQVNENNLEPNTTLTSEDLEDYAVTTTIIVESETGETTFTYTEPKFE